PVRACRDRRLPLAARGLRRDLRRGDGVRAARGGERRRRAPRPRRRRRDRAARTAAGPDRPARGARAAPRRPRAAPPPRRGRTRAGGAPPLLAERHRRDAARLRRGDRMRIRYLAPRRPDTSIAYQRYYLLGFEELGRIFMRGGPLLSRHAPGVDLKIRLAYRLARGPDQAHVGRYEAELDGRTVLFAIDAHDGRAVFDEEALTWSELYFKANRWPGDDYDPRVLPVVNGNGLLDRGKIETLRGLRDAPKGV